MPSLLSPRYSICLMHCLTAGQCRRGKEAYTKRDFFFFFTYNYVWICWSELIRQNFLKLKVSQCDFDLVVL